MEIGDQRDRAAVAFLGEGGVVLPGPQARLDMGDRDAAVEGGEGRGHRRGRVALNNDPVGRELHEHRVQPLDEARDQRVEGLLRHHRLEVEVGVEREQVQYRSGQITMLAGNANMRGHAPLGAESRQYG